MNIFKGILYNVIAQIFTFLQLQGQLKYDFLKNNIWFTAMMGVPLSLLYILSVRHLTAAYNGQMWPSRLIGFGTGVIIFTIMSYLMFKEPLSLKTLTCLGLGICIILIQIFWK
jgi:multidrug transporter EmrE-like cation transporter